MKATGAKALKAITYAEASKGEFCQFRGLTGHKKDRTPLTQVEIHDPDDPSQTILLTNKESIEQAITQWNQNHSRQSPFAANNILAFAVDPTNPQNKIEEILNGTFLDNTEHRNQLTLTEQEWVSELTKKIDQEINTTIETTEFQGF
jgi:hypothetical protein